MKATLIGLMLLKNSKGYQLMLINKVIPDGYYKYDMDELRFLLEKLHNKCRRLNLGWELRRFYVIKNKTNTNRNGMVYKGELWEGEKLRPIGCPDLPTRIMSKAFNDMIYALFKDRLAINQHGYREERGVHTAVFALIRYIRKNPEYKIYEFDLRSFFNKVRPSGVYRILLARGQMIAEIIAKIHIQIRYRFKILEKEEELKIDGKMIDGNGEAQTHIIREGLPQGLSISPLLATLVLETFKAPKGLFLYADDGVFVGNSEERFEKGFERLELTGARRAWEKSGGVKEVFSFLGGEINLKTKTLRSEDFVISFYDKELKDKLKLASAKLYRKTPKKGGNGEVNKRSYLALFLYEESLYFRGIPIFYNKIVHNLPGKSFMYFKGIGVRNFIVASSECLNLLAQRQYELNLKTIKPFRSDSFVAGNKFGNFVMDKSSGDTKYIESIYENQLRAGVKKELPEGKNLLENDPAGRG